MMSFRMVSLIASKLGKLSGMPTVSTRSCSRHVSRDTSKAWMGQSQTHRTSVHRHRGKERFEEDPDMHDVDDKVQAVLSEERRRQRTVKYHIVRRQLTESGAPERRLSWDAMEQIRYLKQELPEEWTVDRLAEGFSVHRDVILRVLRSKFTPTPERKAKQDVSVWARLRQQALPGGGSGGQERQVALPGGAGGPGRSQLPGSGHISSKPAMLPTGSGTGALVTLASQSLIARDLEDGPGPRAMMTTGNSPAAPLTSLPTQVSTSPTLHSRRTSGQDISREEWKEEEKVTEDGVWEKVEGKDEQMEERWDGKVFSEDELEELILSTKPSPVVQNGKEFFDSEGNLLYRI